MNYLTVNYLTIPVKDKFVKFFTIQTGVYNFLNYTRHPLTPVSDIVNFTLESHSLWGTSLKILKPEEP